MTEIYTLATLWLALALLATLMSIWLRIATAMSEIIVGTVAQLIIGAAIGECDPRHRSVLDQVPREHRRGDPHLSRGRRAGPAGHAREWKQATIVGLVAFAAPFLGCAAVARYAA